jgi:hypothetical protein
LRDKSRRSVLLVAARRCADELIFLGAGTYLSSICWSDGGNPISGASSNVAIRTDVASFGDNHFVRCDLLRHHVIHARARKALEAKALLQPTPTAAANGQARVLPTSR